MKFKIMSGKGDFEGDYDLETAELKFNELTAANMLPVALDGKGDKKVLKQFDPNVEEITWMFPIAGG